jgi:hypothetical protein
VDVSVVKHAELLSEEQRIVLAERFSEGSQEYHDFLLRLWENNIETIAGCSGILDEHPPETHYCTHAYIFMRISKDTKRLLAKFVDILKANNFDKEYVLRLDNDTICLKMASLRFQKNHTNKYTRTECENFFKMLNDHFIQALSNKRRKNVK